METLMSSKLHKPILPKGLVVKPELLTQLSASRVALVCAQAGSGKSTVVSYWLDHQNTAYLWYGLDQWDNDLGQFLTYLAEGLSPIDEQQGRQILQLVTAGQSIQVEQLIKTVISLLHQLTVPAVLVLDDYHYIQEPSIHQFMTMLLAHLPPYLQLCIISREDPPMPLAKLRASRQLTEVRMSALRFSLDEAEALFQTTLERALSREQVASLYDKSEGWIAGLQLMALSLASTDDLDDFIKAFSGDHYYIMDYLMEEVLVHHTPAMRHFLLYTSILPYFTPQMCEDVLELSPGEGYTHIEYLLKTNSFLIPLDAKAHWYRYHHLFEELLKQRLYFLKPADLEGLYRRAGNWFEKQGQWSEAVNHYLEGGCTFEAAALIEKRWATMDIELRSSTWLEWAKKLPGDLLEKSPVLCLGYGWSLLNTGDLVTCEPWFVRAEALYEDALHMPSAKGILISDQSALHDLPAFIMVAKAYSAAIEGRYDDLLTWTERASAFSAEDHWRFTWVAKSLMAMFHWGNGNLDTGIDLMQVISKDTLGRINPVVQHSFIWVIGELYIQKGTLAKAQFMLESAIDSVLKEGIAPVLLATYYLLLALIATIRGDRRLAFELLETSRSYGYRFEYHDWHYKYYTLLGRLYLQEGLYEKVKECIAEGRASIFRNPIPETYTIETLDLWLFLAAEQDERRWQQYVVEAMREAEGFSDQLPSYLEETRWKIIMNYAPVQIYGEVLEGLCQRLLSRAEVQHRYLHIIEYTLLLRRFEKSPWKRETLLQRAQKIADSEGIQQPFIELAQEYASQGISQEPSPQVQREQINRTLPEPLTGRELELLGLINAGYSNQQISDTLFIALSTVKSYNNNLFGKLDVKRRTEAIMKAKVLGLLES
jgi:LuxR family maltose regulon positive regulatory protein